MPKEIKKYYNFMNLSYSSSVEEVKERENVMINALKEKTTKKNKSYSDKINKIEVCAKGIVNYIEKNGVPNVKDNLFNTPSSSLFSQLIILFSVMMVLAFSIYSLI